MYGCKYIIIIIQDIEYNVCYNIVTLQCNNIYNVIHYNNVFFTLLSCFFIMS
jgi:hypothetical protein